MCLISRADHVLNVKYRTLLGALFASARGLTSWLSGFQAIAVRHDLFQTDTATTLTIGEVTDEFDAGTVERATTFTRVSIIPRTVPSDDSMRWIVGKETLQRSANWR